MDKRGDISIAVIITAVIALVVLVILVMIFTGKMGVFKTGVEKAGETELRVLQISYGDCRPGKAAENDFLSNLARAGEDETTKDNYRSDFNRLINDCKAKTETECAAPCVWEK